VVRIVSVTPAAGINDFVTLKARVSPARARWCAGSSPRPAVRAARHAV